MKSSMGGVAADESALEVAEGLAEIRGKPLREGNVPLDKNDAITHKMFSSLSDEKIAKYYRAVTGFNSEEEVYRKVLDMINSKKYNEGSAFLLMVVRKIWPDHERRVKEHLRENQTNPKSAEYQAKTGLSPYDTYWSKTIRQYLDWATVLAKSI